jgi:hypothetical protein
VFKYIVNLLTAFFPNPDRLPEMGSVFFPHAPSFFLAVPLDRQRITGLYFQMACQLALLLLYSLSNRPREDIILDRPAQVIDLRNAFEPIALLNISQLCRTMKVNDTAEIRVEDSDFHGNLLRLLHCFPVQVLSDNKCSGSETVWHVIIQKHNQEERR